MLATGRWILRAEKVRVGACQKKKAGITPAFVSYFLQGKVSVGLVSNSDDRLKYHCRIRFSSAP